jgi:DNA-binding MarR family transcriptional regulator
MNERLGVSFKEKMAIKALLRSLKPIGNIGHRTSFATVMAFLFVALEEGKTGSAYARDLGVTRYTALRWFHILGDRKRDHSPGFGLVVFKPAPHNQRQNQIFLSAKGRKLASEIFHNLRGAIMNE